MIRETVEPPAEAAADDYYLRFRLPHWQDREEDRRRRREERAQEMEDAPRLARERHEAMQQQFVALGRAHGAAFARDPACALHVPYLLGERGVLALNDRAGHVAELARRRGEVAHVRESVYCFNFLGALREEWGRVEVERAAAAADLAERARAEAEEARRREEQEKIEAAAERLLAERAPKR